MKKLPESQDFTDRENGLLQRWGERNVPLANAAFERRLLLTYMRAQGQSIHASDADATEALMAADAMLEAPADEADVRELMRPRTRGDELTHRAFKQDHGDVADIPMVRPELSSNLVAKDELGEAMPEARSWHDRYCGAPMSPVFPGWAGTQSRRDPNRPLYMLGGFVIASAVVAIAIVLATRHPSSPERLISYDQIAASSAGSAVVEPGAAPQPLAPRPTPIIVDAAEKAAPPMTASDLEAECRGYQVDRKWGDLAQCSDTLKPLDPKRAAELRIRAVEEARSAPRIAGVAAALQAKDLKRAKTELDQVWTESVEYAKLKRTYEIAEAQAIAGLAEQLDRVKSPSCEAYNQRLAKERAVNPPRVTVEAARRIPCVAPPACNAEALSEKALAHYRLNQLAESLASFEAAYTCKPSPPLLLRTLVIACNLRNVVKARSYWKRLSLDSRARVLSTCARNDITEAILNAP